MNIICFLPVIGQPRHAKRIEMLKEGGFKVKAVAFERDYFQGRRPICPIESLGFISRGNYFDRFFPYIKALPQIRRNISDVDCIYCFGLDMALLAQVASVGKRIPVVLETGDIRRIQVLDSFFGKIIRFIDKIVTKKCRLIVVTAKGFLENYYREWLNVETSGLILENKLEPDSLGNMPLVENNSDHKPLRIGYFGLLRCRWSWEVLEAIARKSPDNVEIVVAGRPIEPSDLPSRAKALRNVKFLGEYRSPDDLPSLYSQVDLVWACYPSPSPGDLNWKWARTNRFYESCYFKKPLITLEGSSDAFEVNKLNIGFSVNGSSILPAIDKIISITSNDLNICKKNLNSLPVEIFQYTNESDRLKEAIYRISS